MKLALGRRLADPDGMEPRGPRILVADDARTMRMLLRTWLERLDCAVVEAKNGTEALAILQGESAVDLAFCDVHMPGLSGLQVLDAIRGDARLQHLPLVLVTTLGNDGDVERGLKRGATAYLKKPVSWGELAAVLHQILPNAFASLKQHH